MYIFQFMGGAISQRSHLQECIALFTTKTQYVQLVSHVRAVHDSLDELVTWVYFSLYIDFFVIIRLPLPQLRIRSIIRRLECDT